MSKKMIALVVLVGLLVSLIAGCTQTTTTTAAPTTTSAGATTTTAAATTTTAAAGKVKIGFSMSQFDDKFLSYLLDAAKAKAATYTDAEFVFTDAKNDPAQQLAQLEQFVQSGCKAIVVNPVDTDATEQYTKLAKDAGIPLISVNRVFKNQDEATSYVGSDSYISGKLEMEYMGEFVMKGEGKIVILRGEDSNEAARLRTQAVKDVIKEKFPKIEILAEDTGKWQRDLGMNIVENWLATDIGKQMTAVISNNDEMALGAVKALENAGKLQDVKVAGIDATPDAIEALKAGKLACTVFQDAKGQGAGAAEAGYKAAKGETLPKVIDIPYVLVRPEDASKY